MNTLSLYIDHFSSLHTNRQKGKPAPHKAILLLSVIDLVEYGAITSNHIELSERLEVQFKRNWKRYVGDSILFKPKVGTPYFHLNSEPFWRLIPFMGGDDAITILAQGNPYSAGTIRKNIKYAEIDIPLFELLFNEDARARLRVVLISHYLQNQPTSVDNIIPLIAIIGSALTQLAS